MKKVLSIVIIILLLLVAAGLFVQKVYNRQPEEMPDIEQQEVVSENETIVQEETAESKLSEEAVSDNTEEQAAEVKQEAPKKVSVIRKAVNKVKNIQHKTTADKVSSAKSESVKEELKTEVKSKTSKFTPEEEELLKKVPRSDEVVVDKEIKVKSSGTYLFK